MGTDLLTTKQVAERLQVKRTTLTSWRREETGPPYLKTGGLIRYRSTDVEQWLASRAVQTDSRPKTKAP